MSEEMTLKGGGLVNILAAIFFALMALAGIILVLSGTLGGLGLIAIAALFIFIIIKNRKNYLHLDPSGFLVHSGGSEWGAKWEEVEKFVATDMPIGKGSFTPVVRVYFNPWVDRPKTTLAQKLTSSEQDHIVCAISGKKKDELAALLERWRAKYAQKASS